MATKREPKQKLSRQERRDLDVEIQFIEGVVRRDPRYVEALQILGDNYTRRGNFSKGRKVDEKLARLRPDDPLVHYNLACSYALTNQVARAVKSLEKAISLGYRDFRWLAKDPDLEKVRRHPSFKKIQAKLQSLRVKVR
ncbi:MAG: hypothetical protein AB1705_03690 [Verrucomicrobiota bacterium]